MELNKCYDNAAMESWFSTYESELGERFESDSQAKDQTFDYIEAFYDTTRRHAAPDCASPARYEPAAELTSPQALGFRRKGW